MFITISLWALILLFVVMAALGANYMLRNSLERKRLLAALKWTQECSQGNTADMPNIVKNSPWQQLFEAVEDMAKDTRNISDKTSDILLKNQSIAGRSLGLRLRGDSGAIFDAVLRNMTDEYERAHKKLHTVIDDLIEQRSSINEVVKQVNGLTSAVVSHSDLTRKSLDGLVREVRSNLVDVVPSLAEETAKLNETTILAGREIIRTLRDVRNINNDVRRDSVLTRESMERTVAAGNALGERMVGAVSLLQACSKTLTNTTDETRNRMNETVVSLQKTCSNMNESADNANKQAAVLHAAHLKIINTMQLGDKALQSLSDSLSVASKRQQDWDEKAAHALHSFQSIFADLLSAQKETSNATETLRRDGAMLGNILKDFEASGRQWVDACTTSATASTAAAKEFADKGSLLISRLDTAIVDNLGKTDKRLNDLFKRTEIAVNNVDKVVYTLDNSASSVKSLQDNMMNQTSQLIKQINNSGVLITKRADAIIDQAEAESGHARSSLTALANDIEQVVQRLDILGQLAGTLGSVAGQLGQIMPALSSRSDAQESTKSDNDEASVISATIREQIISVNESIELTREELLAVLRMQREEIAGIRDYVLSSAIKAPVAMRSHDVVRKGNSADSALAKLGDHVRNIDALESNLERSIALEAWK